MADNKRIREQTKDFQQQVQTPGSLCGSVVSEFHDYSIDLDSSQNSETASPDPKKGKIEGEPSLSQVQETITNLIKECHVDLSNKIGQNKEAIDDNKKAIEDLKQSNKFLFEEIQEVKTNTTKIEVTSTQHEQRIADLEDKINNMERQQRRINLRLHGLPENEGENLKNTVIDICRSVAPPSAPVMGEAIVDICHRVGPRREANRPRPIIIRFVTRDARDHVWKTAKTADTLKARRLRFSEDLTARDKEIRSALWPLVDEARKAEKKAYFVGVRAFVDGKEIKLKK